MVHIILDIGLMDRKMEREKCRLPMDNSNRELGKLIN